MLKLKFFNLTPISLKIYMEQVHRQGVKYFRGPNYQDFCRIIMTFFIILSGIWGKKYSFEKVYIYILKHPRLWM